MYGPPPSPHRFQPWRALVGAMVGWAVLAGGYAAGLLAAYQLTRGSIAGFDGPAGSSYLADDLHDVPGRSLATILVALPIWWLFHNYGRRGPVAALLYALAVGWIGYKAVSRDGGPIDRPAQYFAYALPVLVALMLTWRLAYRRVALPTATVHALPPRAGVAADA